MGKCPKLPQAANDPMPTPYPNPDFQAPLEWGGDQPQARDSTPLPPGVGRFAAPHFLTFSQLVNLASRTYRWQFDEALRHNRLNALAIRRDPVVMDALRSRQIPTAQLPWHIECENDKDTRQADAVTEITAIIQGIPHFQTLKMHLLEALWGGRYGVQLKWKWDFSSGRRRMVVADHKPINGDKLVFRYSGQAGILVHATFPGAYEITERGRGHFFTPEEREAIIIHRHEPEDADFFEPELAGSVQGVGIRSRIYWFWWLRSQVSAFLMDYLERIGAGGFTIYYYQAGDKSSLEEVQKAAEEQHRNNTILFPRYRDGSTGGPGVQRIEPSNSGAQLLQGLISGYFDEVIRRFILGQNLTSEARGTGLGSGVADLHADTFARLVKYDAINLGETLTTDLVAVIQKYLFPGLPPLRFVFDVDKPNAADVLASAQAFYQMGGAVDEDELRSIIGLAKPQPGHSILAKMGSLAPAGMPGMPGVPMGVPMMGQPGPDLGPPGLDGGGGPMMMGRRGEPQRYARIPWGLKPKVTGLTYEEYGWLRRLAEGHRDPDVRSLAAEVLGGDVEALLMLHDQLLDLEEDQRARSMADLAGHVLSRKSSGPPDDIDPLIATRNEREETFMSDYVNNPLPLRRERWEAEEYPLNTSLMQEYVSRPRAQLPKYRPHRRVVEGDTPAGP